MIAELTFLFCFKKAFVLLAVSSLRPISCFLLHSRDLKLFGFVKLMKKKKSFSSSSVLVDRKAVPSGSAPLLSRILSPQTFSQFVNFSNFHAANLTVIEDLV